MANGTGGVNAMDYVNPESLVSTGWLAANLTNAKLRIVDSSW